MTKDDKYWLIITKKATRIVNKNTKNSETRPWTNNNWKAERDNKWKKNHL